MCCVVMFTVSFLLLLLVRPDSQSSLERLLPGDPSCLEPHEETEVWQVTSAATDVDKNCAIFLLCVCNLIG